MVNASSSDDDRLKFFVYVIESPSATDLYHRRGEGDLLRQAINLNQISCTLRLAINLQAFEAALSIGLSEAMASTPNCIPILHISAHGFKDGIQLSSDQIIEWHQLRHLLLPINRALGGALIVCMSTCEGHSGIRMAMVSDSDEHPFFAVVGNGSKPTWPETAVGFATFYHLVANGRKIEDAVKAMCVASGNDSFFVTTAERSKIVYLEHIASLDPATVQEELEQDTSNISESELTKVFRSVDDSV